MLTRIKVCCIMSRDEAHMAINAGAWALGLVAEMPSGQGPISDEAIAEIVPVVPDNVETFLLTSRVDAESIIEHQQFCGTSTVQMVDHVPHGELLKIRRALPGVRLVQVIHVLGDESIDEAQAVAPLVDMILLDSGKPQAELRTLGGTGDTHDWEISRRIREQLEIPVLLAGGLNPQNVADAIARVGPYGVDLCSGIRSNGRLDQQKLTAFVSAVGVRG